MILAMASFDMRDIPRHCRLHLIDVVIVFGGYQELGIP
jgi:hypothetical protein